ncbi:MAG TPA: 16S rRNA (uracil(1498)-N(3))-methyltransferase [Methyloceanibacter sp.]|jgi:16S rRNA (uracil1498-N3)-methyltransferase|nr:16S rRNA (uracil(1498)-N(3))-methyltransferase [Methyloceanibacter sp.]
MPSKPQRLFVTSRLAAGASVELDPPQAHYLINVLRCKAGDGVLLFNGEDGEWSGSLSAAIKKRATIVLAEQTRPQIKGPDLHYLFAPLKRARLDYVAQKGTEMGARLLKPVITRRTVAQRVNTARLTANAIEAAEQCGILWVPEVGEPGTLSSVLETWDPDRLLVFADEAAPHASPLAALSAERPRPFAVLIGPEGGFAEEERALLLSQPFVLPISLGPRLMRADTAAVAALALVNATIGDWRS